MTVHVHVEDTRRFEKEMIMDRGHLKTFADSRDVDLKDSFLEVTLTGEGVEYLLVMQERASWSA